LIRGVIKQRGINLYANIAGTQEKSDSRSTGGNKSLQVGMVNSGRLKGSEILGRKNDGNHYRRFGGQSGCGRL